MHTTPQPAAKAATHSRSHVPLCLLLCALALLGIQPLRAQMQSIDLAEPPAQWQAIFNALGHHPRIEAEFAERRFFAFRRFPRRLEGQMIYNEARGFALNYTSPSRYTIFVQPSSVHIVRGESDPDEIPQGASSAATLKVMPYLMGFAPQKLAEDFNANGMIDADGSWQLSLRPRVIGSLPGIQEIRMAGTGGDLQRLVLVRAANERSEIDIRSSRFPTADEPEVLNWPDAGSQP